MRGLSILIAGAAAIGLPSAGTAQTENPQIDYDRFVELSVELAETRKEHLINLKTFSEKASEAGTIVLDTRSAEAFRLGHLKGAINLPFSDFTDEKLAKVLGKDQKRQILIYCNNNFSDNRRPITLKRVSLALNIPTFINLHGYGYTNIWELADVVSTKDVEWIAEPEFVVKAP